MTTVERERRLVADQAERSLIGWLTEGSAASEPARVVKVLAVAPPDRFYGVATATIMRTIAAQWFDDRPLDRLAVMDRMLSVDAPAYERLGIGTVLAECGSWAGIGDPEHNAGIIARDFHRRTNVERAVRLAQIAEDGDLDKFTAYVTEVGEHIQREADTAGPSGRIVDLSAFLDGSYTPLEPSVGAQRRDGLYLLYAGRWHTLIGLTTAGKSWLALWHCVEQMRRGSTVVYAHFEEASPAGTIERLVAFGATFDMIRNQFNWLDCTKVWAPSEYARTLAALPGTPTLAILDGINAACTQHGWPVDKPEAIGSYRAQFVAPATSLGAAVLSLGHPPKGRDRQGERHSYGGTGWLDEVDGASYRLEACKTTPVRRGQRGYSALYSVKDRPGQVELHGVIDGERESGWYSLGSFWVDNSDGRTVQAELVAAQVPEGGVRDAIDTLGERILYHLVRHGGRFTSAKQLGDCLRAEKVTFNDADVRPALERLAGSGRLHWPPVPSGKARPGWVIDTSVDTDDE